MNMFLWVIQGVLALLFISGGATKVFKFDDLAKMPAMAALPRNAWRVVGILEMLGALLLILPGALGWMPELTPDAAAVLAVESLLLAILYGRHSRQITASNPLVWSVTMGVLSAFVAYGRCVISPLA